MKPITRYQSDDGSIWDTAEQATHHDGLLSSVAGMTWKDKLAKLRELTKTTVHRRTSGSCYVSGYGRETQEEGRCGLLSDGGNGITPEAAVEDDWNRIAGLPSWKYIVLDAMGDNRRHVRWDGTKWVDLLFEAGVVDV
jgi:hypothetical protein